VVPLPVWLEPVSKQQAVRLDGKNPTVGAGLQDILATVADCSAGKREAFHTNKVTPC